MEEKTEDIITEIKHVFKLFDHQKNNTIAKKDVSAAIRVFPTNAEIEKAILPDLISNSATNLQGSTTNDTLVSINDATKQTSGNDRKGISYEAFEKKILEIKSAKLFESVPKEQLIRAFQTVEKHCCGDEKLKGFVKKDDLAALLKQKEFNLDCTEEEIQEFLKIAVTHQDKDSKNDKIYYFDYVDELFLQIQS
ncbi:hypothetical protein RFI_11763 [Reticulomyxa filosa]|uniref:EF-hand domain-containing protein n=1 Tax=Reticulomyxa filosa TaxID=46433 RepID=X6NHE6_RETFI|nr:hypothetical protein RFI_11763 [Reticulomyxa filosa]|eukprot:ETO25376.1 hypothetical protein RFI_11763 [Reticulomyxa filosa]